jgi:hypothetical protein
MSVIAFSEEAAIRGLSPSGVVQERVLESTGSRIVHASHVRGPCTSSGAYFVELQSFDFGLLRQCQVPATYPFKLVLQYSPLWAQNLSRFTFSNSTVRAQ